MATDKTIFIMRHAKSSWDDSSQKDFDRPLNKRGRRDAPAMGHYLAELERIPDYIVCSAAQRARETVLLLTEAAGVDERNIRWNEALYYEGVNAYLKSIKSAPNDSKTVLVAGHNPTVGQTVARLSGGLVRRKITTANIACFHTTASVWDDVSELNTSFKWLIGPKDI